MSLSATGLSACSFSAFKCIFSTFKRYGFRTKVVFLRLISFKLVKLRSAFLTRYDARQTLLKRMSNAFDMRFNEFKTSVFFFPVLGENAHSSSLISALNLYI